MATLIRANENPILLPSGINDWEKRAAFNPSVVEVNGTFHLVYRALSETTYYQGHSLPISTVGYATSTDGIHFTDHRQLIKPEYLWELFGCEDPRIIHFNDKFYIFYTALSNYPFNAEGIKVGVAITKDFQSIEEKHLVTPFNAKAMALFPDKVNGRLAVIMAANTDIPPAKIAIAYFDKEEEMWDESMWKKWYAYLDDHALDLQRDKNDQVEVGAVPIKTDQGWLLIHSYITNYYSDQKVFGIEAALLDLDDPFKILGRTDKPLLVPEKDYEKFGEVPNIAFPSGGVVHDGKLYVYYGAADTSGCVATCDLQELIHEIYPSGKKPVETTVDDKVTLTRFVENPIITPIAEHAWENKATFNPAAVYDNGKVHIIYRAMSQNNMSAFGYAASTDGYHISERLPDPVYIPREVFEKNMRAGNAGCEDPRITKMDDRYYVLYTAYDGEHPPRVAMSSISVDDFNEKKWHWAIPKLISPPEIDDKDACLLPKKINGKYMFFHRLQTAIWIDYADDLHFYEGKYLGGSILMEGRKDGWDNGRIGISSVPIETEKGWILLYHGIDEKAGHHYKVGAALLDLHNPGRIISRLDYPIFGPEMHYEKDGQIPNVVFPCGSIVKDNEIFVYYGGADSVVGVATVKVEKLLNALTSSK